MTVWHPNCGYDPNRDLPEDAPPILRVYVRLRNGMEPADSWPVSTGKADTTRWAFGMKEHPFDIIAWRPA